MVPSALCVFVITVICKKKNENLSFAHYLASSGTSWNESFPKLFETPLGYPTATTVTHTQQALWQRVSDPANCSNLEPPRNLRVRTSKLDSKLDSELDSKF